MMLTVQLANICKISKGKKVSETESSELRYIQIDDLRHNNNIKYANTKDKHVHCTENDILIAWDGANAGTIGYNLKGAIGSTLAKITLTSDVLYPPYIAKFLQSKFDFLQQTSTGATIPHISKTALLSLTIKTPSITTQQKIAAILDQAQALIDCRKQQIAQLDQLAQSTFLEMFGDPITNPMGWETLPFSDIAEINRGVSKHRPRNDPRLLGGAYPLIQTGDVSRANRYIKTYNSTYSDLGLSQSKLWKAGTLCITIAANIADAAILEFNACFPDSVVGVIVHPYKTNNIYIHSVLLHLKNTIDSKATQVAQKNINLPVLRNLLLPIPPLKKQNQFASIIENIEAQKSQLQQSLGQLEMQFNALIQRAFNGELIPE